MWGCVCAGLQAGCWAGRPTDVTIALSLSVLGKCFGKTASSWYGNNGGGWCQPGREDAGLGHEEVAGEPRALSAKWRP